MTKYLAFLRGINVGGNKKVEMAKLKKTLESLGHKNVSTLLNSGNATFETASSDSHALTAIIEKKLEDVFNFPIPVLLRSSADVEKLMKSDPFKSIKVTENTRLYVTFLSEKPQSKLKIPYTSPDGSYRILRVSRGDICSVLQLNEKARTVDAMAILEKEFGKKITTRNWNTIQKLMQ